MNGPEVYATVFALAPSKMDVNVLWAGSDDGLIHVTRDGGKTWANVTPQDMPDFGRVSIIDASAFDAGTAYAAVKRPLLGDLAPYLFRTHDYGKTWTKIVNGLSADDYAHAIREDQKRRDMLYAGTQHGVYFSYDDGDTWQSLSLNLPDVQVSRPVVEDTDLAIATHGRGVLHPRRHRAAAAVRRSVLAGATRFSSRRRTRSGRRTAATIQYWVKKPAQSLTIEVVDPKGTVVRTFADATAAAGRWRGRAGAGGGGGGRWRRTWRRRRWRAQASDGAPGSTPSRGICAIRARRRSPA